MYVDPEATKYLDRETQAIENPKDNQLIVAPECVMSSAAGYYVGSVCAEYTKDFGWMYQPFDRYTEYMTKEDAETWINLNNAINNLEELDTPEEET